MSEFLQSLVQHLPEWLPQLLVACGETLQLTVVSFLLAIVGGVWWRWLRRSGSTALRATAVVYVEIARGMPALVILFLIYFALPTALPALQFNSFTAACIGLGLQGAALLGEIFRAGLAAVDRGQREAALTLGLTPRQSLIYVVAPQAVRVALAPTGNYAIGLLKDTSIASIIAAPDLMLRAKDLASSSFLPMQLYVLAAVLYFAMSWPLARLVRRLEHAYAAPHQP